MDGTPRNGPPLPCTPLTAPQARAIAEAFRPARAWGSRRDYYYTRGKLGSDPLYDGVLQHLPDDGQPLLDLGCGLGLFAHVLRQRSGTHPTSAWTWMPARSSVPSVPPPGCTLCASTAWTCRRHCRRSLDTSCCWMCCSTWTRAHNWHCCVRPARGYAGASAAAHAAGHRRWSRPHHAGGGPVGLAGRLDGHAAAPLPRPARAASDTGRGRIAGDGAASPAWAHAIQQLVAGGRTPRAVELRCDVFPVLHTAARASARALQQRPL